MPQQGQQHQQQQRLCTCTCTCMWRLRVPVQLRRPCQVQHQVPQALTAPLPWVRQRQGRPAWARQLWQVKQRAQWGPVARRLRVRQWPVRLARSHVPRSTRAWCTLHASPGLRLAQAAQLAARARQRSQQQGRLMQPWSQLQIVQQRGPPLAAQARQWRQRRRRQRAAARQRPQQGRPPLAARARQWRRQRKRAAVQHGMRVRAARRVGRAGAGLWLLLLTRGGGARPCYPSLRRALAWRARLVGPSIRPRRRRQGRHSRRPLRSRAQSRG